jgi:hypothetical protein
MKHEKEEQRFLAAIEGLKNNQKIIEARQKLAERNIDLKFSGSIAVGLLVRGLGIPALNVAFTQLMAEKLRHDEPTMIMIGALFTAFMIAYGVYDYRLIKKHGNGSVAATNLIYHSLEEVNPKKKKRNAIMAEIIVGAAGYVGVDVDWSALWALHASFESGNWSFIAGQKAATMIFGGIPHYIYSQVFQEGRGEKVKKMINKFKKHQDDRSFGN